MKKNFLVFIALPIFFTFGFVNLANAQVSQEEAMGKAIFEKFQSKETDCSKLSDDDFEKLGDYYMGQMTGTSHEAMDNLMTQRMGESNNRLMHIALGQRFSGCNVSAQFPSQGTGFLPMMGMMGNWSYSGDNANYVQPNGFNSMMGNYFGNSMMGFGYGYGLFGIIFMVFFWVIIIVAIVALVKWFAGWQKNDYKGMDKNALSILEQRYAKGEIDKKEFEEKKKDLIN